MTKIYQPIVIEYSNEIVDTLIESEFFLENEIDDYTFAKNFLCEKLTEKFITTGLDREVGIFTEDEFNDILKNILAGSVLYSLKNKGYINSYEDENTEELFFLTEEGKKYVEELKKQKED